MKKVFALLTLLCFLICLLPVQKTKADSFPTEFFVNSEVYYSASELWLAYNKLNATQTNICSYLLGMYNLMYLGARGFVFRVGAYRDESSFIAKIRTMGYQLLQGANEVAIKSRMDANFCKYASACILYASQCNVPDFDTWFDNLDDDFMLPVDQGLINSFTLYYNNNDNTSISLFGDVTSNWDSGVQVEYAFPELNNTSLENRIVEWVGDLQYVLFSNVQEYNSGTFFEQTVIATNELPDTLFLRRLNNGFDAFAWGNYYGEAFHRLNFESYKAATYYYNQSWNQWGDSFSNSFSNFNRDVISITFFNDLSDCVYYIFNHYSPILATPQRWYGAYPAINHVVLVDDLGTLANAQEVFLQDSWDVFSDQSNLIVPIDKVDIKPKLITTFNLPDNSEDPVPIQDIISDENTVDENGDPVSPWQVTIIMQPNETNPISIDVGLFSSAKVYIEYLWNNATSFLQYCKDLLDCFAFEDMNGADYGPKYAIYGVIVLGVASGLIAKFLL